MTISEIDLFDLYGDGTLVMRTKVDDATDDLRYTWYVKRDGQLIYKAGYQRNPFSAIRIEHLGRYEVKAFVRNGNGEKVEKEAAFVATRKTSPQLAADDKGNVSINPKAEYISGSFWRFYADGKWPQDTKYAWYIYREGKSEPVSRIMYSPESRYVHKFEEPGLYHAKLFVLVDGKKQSAFTDWFEVTL